MDLMPIGPFAGIYVLIINNKKYIGSSKNINKRITEHKRLLNLGTHYNKSLQKAYTECNNNLVGYCIEKCNDDKLFDREQFYIDFYKPELNISLRSHTAKLPPELVNIKQGGSRNHMAKITLSQAVDIVKERLQKLTLKEISTKLSISYDIVASICSANNWKYELEQTIPVEYAEMVSARESVGLENRSKFVPKNRLFDDEKLLDVLEMLEAGSTLEVIADKYNTNKTTISTIKNYKVYKKDIKRLLSEDRFIKLFGAKL